MISIRELIVNVDSLDDLIKVIKVLDKVHLEFTATPIPAWSWKVVVQHELEVRLARLYTELTGELIQHLDTPCVLMYSNL